MAGLERAQYKKLVKGGNKQFAPLAETAPDYSEAEQFAKDNPPAPASFVSLLYGYEPGPTPSRQRQAQGRGGNRSFAPLAAATPDFSEAEEFYRTENEPPKKNTSFLTLSNKAVAAELTPVSEEEAGELGLQNPFPLLKRLRENYQDIYDADPVQAAGWNRLANETGITRWAMEQDPEMKAEAERRQREIEAGRVDFSNLAENYPATANFLTDPYNMTVALRSLPELVKGESVFQSMARSWRASALDVEKSKLFARQMMGDNSTETKERIAELNRQIEDVGAEPDEWLNRFLWQTVQILPQFMEQWKKGGGYGAAVGAGTAALTALSGGQMGPQAALPEEVVTVPASFLWGMRKGFIAGGFKTSFDMEAGSAYEEYKKIPGIDDNVAKTAAFAVGAVNAGLELTEFSTLIKSFPGGKNFLRRTLGKEAIAEALHNPAIRESLLKFGKKYAGTLSFETAQEIVQELVTILGSQYARSKSGAPLMSGEDVAARLGETGWQSLQGFAIISALGPGSGLARDFKRATNAHVSLMGLRRVADLMDRTEVKDLDPQTAQACLKENLKGTGKETAYTDAKPALKLFQDAKDAEEKAAVAEALGVTEEEARIAADNGVELEIPTEKLMTAPTDMREALFPYTRTEPDGMTQHEADAFNFMISNMKKDDALAYTLGTKQLDEDYRSMLNVADSQRMVLINSGRDETSATQEAYAMSYIYNNMAHNWNLVFGTDKKRLLAEDMAKMFPLSVVKDTDGSLHIDGKYFQAMGEKGARTLDAWQGVRTRMDNLAMAKSSERVQKFFQDASDTPVLTGIDKVIDDAKKEIKATKTLYNGTNMFGKAPNGNKSQLSDEQWVLVRTPAFKKWFGNWEAKESWKILQSRQPVAISDTPLSIEKAQDIYKSIDISKANRIDGIKAKFVSGIFGKLRGHQNHDLIFKCFPVINELFENAVPIYVERERNSEKSRNMVGFHNYLTKAKDKDGTLYYVRFTIQELTPSRKSGEIKGKTQLHSVAISDINVYTEEQINKAASPTVSSRLVPGDLVRNSFTASTQAASSGIIANGNEREGFVDLNVAKWLADVKSNNNSVILDDNGEPLVVYHKTSNTFSEFDKWYLGSNTIENAGRFGAASTSMLGFWFNDSGNNVSGEISMPVYLNIKNPYYSDSLYNDLELKIEQYVSDEDRSNMDEDTINSIANQFKEDLQKQGYDGIVVNDEEYGGTSYVAFEQNQIKSAIKNAGTFDTNNNNIYYQEHRGAIEFPSSWGNGQPARITLGPQSDRSTVMHEMAHFYLWQLRNFRTAVMAQRPNLQPFRDVNGNIVLEASQPSTQIAKAFADLDKVDSWWSSEAEDVVSWLKSNGGIIDATKSVVSADGLRAWLADANRDTTSELGQAYDTATQEYFARGFEKYLAEGKAPTAEMQGVFRKFKAWLCEIYRNLTELHVNLNDDVRAVYDRMLASDEAIEQFRTEEAVAKELGVDPTEENEAVSVFEGDDPFEAAKERLLTRLLGEIAPDRMKEISDRAEELRPTFVQQIMSEKAWQVMDLLAKSPELRINEDDVREAYGEDTVKSMPEGTLAKDGVGIDFAAKSLGYGSADEMIEDLNGRRQMAEEADSRVKAVLQQEFASAISDPQELDAAAEAAWYDGEERSDELAAEAAVPRNEFADVYEADERAKAAENDPGSRRNVLKWIREHGGVKYDSVVTEFGKERAEELRKRAPFIFRKDGFGLDELAQELNGNNVPMASDEALFNLLLSEDVPKSPLDVAKAEGAAKEREKIRARQREKSMKRALSESIKKKYRGQIAEKKGNAKNAAENITSQMTVQHLRDNVKTWIRNEKDARMYAERALRKGDEAGYQKWREKELINHEVVRSMYRGVRSAEYIRAYLEKFANRRQKQTFGMSAPYIRQVDSLVERFGLRKMRGMKAEEMAAAEPLPSLADFAAEMERDGTPFVAPDWITQRNDTMHYSQLMLWQLRDVENTVRNIVTAGRDEKKTISFAENKLLTDIAAQIQTKARGFWGESVTGGQVNDPTETKTGIASKVRYYFDQQLTAEEICRAMDGFEDMGPMTRYVLLPIRDAVTNENLRLNEVFAKFRQLRDDCYGGKNPKMDNWTKTFSDIPLYEAYETEPGVWTTKATNKSLTLTHEQALCVFLNMGNADNIQRLMSGWGWTEKQCREIQDSLSEQDLKYAQGVWDLVNELWPDVRKVHELMTGTVLDKVEARPLDTKYGKLKGGYYPIVTDLRYSATAAAQSERETVMSLQPLSFASTYTKSGHRKARGVDVQGRPPLLALSVLDNHIANVIHDFELAPALRDVRKILNLGMVHNALLQAMGDNAPKILNKWLNDVAGNTKNNGIIPQGADRFVNGTKSGVAMFSLGANLGGAMMQPLGYFPLAHRIGFINAGKALLRLFTENEGVSRLTGQTSVYEFVRRMSPFMKEQMDGSLPEVRRLRENWSATNKGLPGYADMMIEIYPLFQNMCNVPGWAVAYDVGLKKFGNEQDAIHYADGVIRQTQSASTIADLSSWERSGTLGQLTTMFYSWFRVMYNMQYEAVMKVMHENGIGRFGDLASYALYVLVGQSVAEALIRHEGPDDDDDDYKWLKWTAGQLLTAPLSTMPVVRDIEAGVEAKYGGYRFTPATAGLENVYKTLGAYAKAVGHISNGEDVDIGGLASKTATTVGYFTGVPNRQMIKAAKAFWADHDEDKAIPWAYLLLGGGFGNK